MANSRVYRHQQGHLPAIMLKARESEEIAHADGLLAQLQILQQKTLEILALATRGTQVTYAVPWRR